MCNLVRSDSYKDRDQDEAKLLQVEQEKLVDALLRYAYYMPEIRDLVEQMTATGEEHEQRIRNKLEKLQSLGRSFSHDQEDILELEIYLLFEDIRTNISDPPLGAELIAQFYQADEFVFNISYGECFVFSMLCKNEAKDLFLKYANRCADKCHIAELLLELSNQGDYGVRDALFDSVAEIFPEPDASKLKTQIDSQLESK